VLDKKRLQELVKEVDPHEQLDEDVEDLLLHIADDFIEQTVSASCSMAKHRKANAVDVKDVQIVLGKRETELYLEPVGVRFSKTSSSPSRPPKSLVSCHVLRGSIIVRV
jgi:transcription initiation factor TFIID subunit TAF12